MAKRTPRKKHVAVEVLVLVFRVGFLEKGLWDLLTTDDQEGRKGRDTAESHVVDWW